jgi:hypothetical protein
MNKFERPSRDPAISKPEERIKFAERVFSNFSGRTPPVGVTVAASASPSSACSQGGLAGSASIIDGFVIYNQFDAAWKNKPYGSSTVGESGCGPSSVAMIVSTFTDQKVTPDVVASKFSNYYVPSVGSSWSLMTEGPEAYGLTSVDIGTDMNRAAAELRNGAAIIATGSGAIPFTEGGHILVLRGITSSGNLLVGDSGHKDTSAKEWDAATLAGYIRNMWVVKRP